MPKIKYVVRQNPIHNEYLVFAGKPGVKDSEMALIAAFGKAEAAYDYASENNRILGWPVE